MSPYFGYFDLISNEEKRILFLMKFCNEAFRVEHYKKVTFSKKER